MITIGFVIGTRVAQGADRKRAQWVAWSLAAGFSGPLVSTVQYAVRIRTRNGNSGCRSRCSRFRSGSATRSCAIAWSTSASSSTARSCSAPSRQSSSSRSWPSSARTIHAKVDTLVDVLASKSDGEAFAPDELATVETVASALGTALDALQTAALKAEVARVLLDGVPVEAPAHRGRGGVGPRRDAATGGFASRSGRMMATVAHFTKDMTVEQAFKTHAGAKRVFARFHLGGCSHCSISETETIEQVSEGYGIPLNLLMTDLEKLFEQPALDVGDAVKLPDEIRAKIPQLASVPEFGKVTALAAGAYTVEFGEVRLQGLAEDFIKVDPTAVPA